MAKRKIIKIDADQCNGCGLCLPNCPEGAIQIIDGKARLISDLFCDGLGACIGQCPQGAIAIEEREAQDYDERKVMEHIIKQGRNTIKAHLNHLKEHKAEEYFQQAIDYLKEKGLEIPLEEARSHEAHAACPGLKAIDLQDSGAKISTLKNWPVQIMLVPPSAPYLKDASLLIAADCVPFAYADFHRELLRGKILLVGCPKLDDAIIYQDKISQILKNNKIKSVTYAHMEVPCCFGLIKIIKSAIEESQKDIPFTEVVISIKGERLK